MFERITDANLLSENLLGFLSYPNAQEEQDAGGNNEFRGCQLGCNRCIEQRDKNQPTETCFTYCKNYVYTDGDEKSPAPIKKGIIEPDKACIIGCVINLCQDMCTGGAAWGSGGCQIMTGYGVQTYSENPSANFDPCCSNLQNVCTYAGPRVDNPNFNSVVKQAQKNCVGKFGLGKKASITAMCAAWDDATSKGEC